ncbi:Gldg family protein [Chitinophaga sp. Hz27]|uniref:Gldg family protein n=1 Tax=Chitinophaga sp. Hz27 TaxID=3347169 RepID=UPI0035D8E344
MRQILKIAKAELFTLFYSPIAWMILVVFTFQTGFVYIDHLEELLQAKKMGYQFAFLSSGIFSGGRGLLASVQNYLYLYMPLLTMALMSRELSSGSIKLLYSSPITSSQIIRGKYIAMLAYSLVLVAVLMVYVVISMCIIENFELAPVLAGILAVYLLIASYAAIGLFMSSLTSYQVVAALGTLVLLGLLSNMGKVLQDVEVVRDITYWLSISGRGNEMINGLICTEDILYFFIVISMFLTLSVLKLQANRTHASFSKVWSGYVVVVIGALVLGYATSRPLLMAYYDTTETKRNTLTPNSQAIMAKLNGGLTITTYVNLLDREVYHGLPKEVNTDKERLKQYIRFKPETKLKYVYYYDSSSNNRRIQMVYKNKSLAEIAEKEADAMNLNIKNFLTPEQIRKQIDLRDEGNTFVRVIERENGQKGFLRIYDDMTKFPTETEITAVFKRMVMKLPRVAFLQGHGERSISGDRNRDYTLFSSVKTFRHSLTNQGCDVESIDLSGSKQIPKEVDIIVIADMQVPLDSVSKTKLDAYVANGGNLVVTLKPGSAVMENFIAQFGVKTIPGQLVQPKMDDPANAVICRPTPQGKALAPIFEMMNKGGHPAYIGMVKAAGLIMAEDKGFKGIPVLLTDTSKTWNELQTIDFINDTATLDVTTGEKADRFVTAMALTRKVGAKEQRIMIVGDADCISNSGMKPPIRRYGASNFNMIPGMFHWLSYGTVPVDVSRPNSTDNNISITKGSYNVMKYGLMGVIPGLILVGSTILLIRRRRK